MSERKPSKETLRHMFGIAGSDYIIGDNSHPFVYVIMNADPIDERKRQAWEFLAFVEHVSWISYFDIVGIDQTKSAIGNDFLSDLDKKTRTHLDNLVDLIHKELLKAKPKAWTYLNVLDALAEFLLSDEVGDFYRNGNRGDSESYVFEDYKEIDKVVKKACTDAAKDLIGFRWPKVYEEAFFSSFFVKAFADWLNACAVACLFSLEVIKNNHIFRDPDSDQRFERLFRAIKNYLGDSRRMLALVRDYLAQLDGDDLISEYGFIGGESSEVNKYVPKKNERGAGRKKIEDNLELVGFVNSLSVLMSEQEKALQLQDWWKKQGKKRSVETCKEQIRRIKN